MPQIKPGFDLVDLRHIHPMKITTPFVYYRGSGFNCEYLLIANCEFLYVLQLINLQTRILQYDTGLSIAIIGFAIWPHSTTIQLLNYAIKTRPTVSQFLNCFVSHNQP